MQVSTTSDKKPELRFDWRDVAIIILLIALALMLYVPRLLPGTGHNPDTMKYHYIGSVLGISHPPGSPLYILINWAVAQIPIGELAWRLNFLSAFCAAVAAGLLYLLGREVARSRLGASLASVALITAGTFWSQSIIAEVYSLHAVLLLASVWLLFRWHRIGSTLDLVLAAALYGLSFGVHLMSWYLLPGWIALVLFSKRSILRRPRELMIVASGALLGMSTYLYYAIRPTMQPLYTEFQINSIGSFFDYITGAYFRKYMFAFDLETMFTERLSWLIDLFLANLGIPLLLLGGIGLVIIFIKDVRVGIFLSSPIALGSLYAMGYSVPDAHVFALPALYILLISVAVGFAFLWRTTEHMTGNRWRSIALIAVVFAAVIFERSGQFASNSILLDSSSDRRFAQYAERIIDKTEDDSTIVAGSDWTFHALAYHLWGKQERADAGIELKIHPPERCEEALSFIDEYLKHGPVYCTTELTSCISAEGYEIEAWDFSRTLLDFFAAIPPGRLVLIAIQDEGTAGIKGPEWKALNDLGLLSDMRGRFRWSYAAVLIRTPDGFRGIEVSREDGAVIDLKRNETISEKFIAPFALSVRSGGQLSGNRVSLLANGIDYARPNRGLQIVVFDAATGTPLERQVFDTHRTISLREFDFFRVTEKKSGAVPD